MRHLFFTSLFLILVFWSVNAADPQREFRAVWIATLVNIDWPSTKITTGSPAQITQQKSELIAIFDSFQATNINAVFFQIRPMADALYQTNITTWSSYLTGTRGSDPGYDPLAFAIEEAHKRGMELHGWMNPYRYTNSATNHPVTDYMRQQHSGWLLDFGSSGQILDPGIPAVRQHIADVTEEIIVNYPDIDGIVWDDYFYISGVNTEDNSSFASNNPNGLSKANWRRDNVNKTVQGVYNVIQAHNPGIRFGIAPRGIWGTKQADANQYGVTLPAGITGADNYNTIYCDGLAWLSQGTIDYISPQLYWATVAGGGAAGQDYAKLAPWWQSVANKYGRHFYSSMAAYQGFTNAEIGRQIDKNRENTVSPGAVFYNTNTLLSQGYNTYLKNNKFQKKILPPKITWKSTTVHPVSNIRRLGNTLHWDCAQTDGSYVIYAVPNASAPTALNNFDYMIKRVWTTSNTFDLLEFSSLMNTHKFAVASVNRFVETSTPKFENSVSTDPQIAADPRSLSFAGTIVEEPKTLTFQVFGYNLSNNITVSASNPAFTVSPSSFAPSTTGTTIDIIFTPTEVKNYSATLTFSSSGATNQTVLLSGQGVEDESALAFRQVWNYSQSKGNQKMHMWDATKVRNMAYDGHGKLYIVNENMHLKVLRAQTGDWMYDLSSKGISEGAVTLADVAVFDGKIVASNIATTGSLKVYVWDDDISEPRLLLNTTNKGGVDRIGDYMGFTGDWSNGKMVFARDDGSSTKIITYTITNGTVGTTPAVITVTNASNGYYPCGASVRVDPVATGYWIDGSTAYLTRLNTSGKYQYHIGQTNNRGNGFSPFMYDTKQYAVMNSFYGVANSSDGMMDLIFADGGNWQSIDLKGSFPDVGLGTTLNTNYTGNAIASAGEDYVEAWVLSSSQGMAYFAHGYPPDHFLLVGKETTLDNRKSYNFYLRDNKLYINDEDVCQIELYTLMGQQVVSTYETKVVDLNDLFGVYVVRLRYKDGEVTSNKVIIH